MGLVAAHCGYTLTDKNCSQRFAPTKPNPYRPKTLPLLRLLPSYRRRRIMEEKIAAAERQMVTERMRKKLNDVNNAAHSHLSPVQRHINFTLQQAYFKCAHECFDPSRSHDDISTCVEHCSVPVLTAQRHFEDEMAKFQERLNRSLMVCQDKYEAAKLQQSGSDASSSLELCVDQTIQENIKTMPQLVGRLKKSLGVRD